MTDDLNYSWIRMVPENEASGELKEKYDFLKNRSGWIAHVLKIHSLKPAMIDHVMNFYVTIMFSPKGIRRRLREMIAVVVSQTNACHY